MYNGCIKEVRGVPFETPLTVGPVLEIILQIQSSDSIARSRDQSDLIRDGSGEVDLCLEIHRLRRGCFLALGNLLSGFDDFAALCLRNFLALGFCHTIIETMELRPQLLLVAVRERRKYALLDGGFLSPAVEEEADNSVRAVLVIFRCDFIFHTLFSLWLW